MKDRQGYGEALGEEFARMYTELDAWYEQHPGASLDEIMDQITPRRRALMGHVASRLVMGREDGEGSQAPVCTECGEYMEYHGRQERGISHLEGDLKLQRRYYHCPRCQRGLFPPGPETGDGATQLDSEHDSNGRAPGGGDSLL